MEQRDLDPKLLDCLDVSYQWSDSWEAVDAEDHDVPLGDRNHGMMAPEW